MKYDYDVAIIGSGPVGLFAGFEAGINDLKACIIDGLDVIGGQCTALYPEKFIYDIPAHPAITAADLIEQLRLQNERFAIDYYLGHMVRNISDNGEHKVITLANGKIITTFVVILALGGGNFVPRKPSLQKLEEYEGTSVFYSVQNKNLFADKNIIIAGGGDSAIDWVLNLKDIVAKIFLLHRRNNFRCAPSNMVALRDAVDSGKVEIVVPYVPEKICGSDGIIDYVEVKHFHSGDIRKIHASYVLLFFGMEMSLKFLSHWDVPLPCGVNGISVNSTTCHVNSSDVSGVYAIGDIAYYEGKNRLIVNGFAEAVNACTAARNMLYPDKSGYFEYSTTKLRQD